MIGELSLHQIEQLLHEQVVGRIGCHSRGRTYVVPVTYAYVDGAIVSHTGNGLKVQMMRDNPSVQLLAAPRVAVRSTVGAGDAMVAGIVLALARGSTLRDAMRYGVAAGSAAVMQPGTALCRADDVDRLLGSVAVMRSRTACAASQHGR